MALGWNTGLNSKKRWQKDPCHDSVIWRGVEIEDHDPRQADDYFGDFEARCAKCRRPTPHLVRRGEKVEIRKCLKCGRSTDIWLDEMDQHPPLGRELRPDTEIPADEPAMERRTKMPKDEHPMDVRTREIVREELEAAGNTGAGVTEQDVREMLAEMFEKASAALRNGGTGGGRSGAKKPRSARAKAAPSSASNGANICSGDESCTRRGKHKNVCPKKPSAAESTE